MKGYFWGVYSTSRIEGEVIDRNSVQSSIRKQLGLMIDKERLRPMRMVCLK
ncbi:DUF4172 domain-containing protein [Arcticibacterium luteifluviistationis]|uniref:DUF4172 domain-containing protein n=1 Tax=Arcticibacterium luteifluviistationis TaxID=1784714 RepID=A0A2Z4GHK4_9BACT|nr:hypothetical protein DJ013_21115 [Arcticibacterium luteifluviistationis]